jgi:hypothetical protein
MTNYRIYKVSSFASSSAWTKLGNEAADSSPLSNAWGIMTPVGMATSGSVTVEGGGDLILEQLTPGQIYPCYPTAIRVSAGTGSVLS